MDRDTSATKLVKKNVKLLSIEVLAVVLIIIGIVLICTCKETLGTEVIKDYTDCIKFSSTEKCSEALIVPGDCQCYERINISQPMDGQVTIYYELDSYDQTRSDYVNSRDDSQLAGVLTATPSSNCGANYSYVETPEGKKPIAPCGAIADSMFNDTFSLLYGKVYLPMITTGLDGVTEADKKKYRNPPGNLAEAFQNFSKPKNWAAELWEPHVWELGIKDPNNVALQNEAFIAWMKTDLKRKPTWRVNHTGIFENGLPNSTYTLRISYAYPLASYAGRRKLIISNLHTVTRLGVLITGIVLLLIGILAIIAKVIYNRKTYGKLVHYEVVKHN